MKKNITQSLPKGWKMRKLGEVCETGAGGTPLKNNKEYYENGNIPWLRSGEVCKKNITECELYISEEGLNNSSAKLFPPNTVLVAMYGATAGQVGILRFESSTNQAVCGIYPNDNFIPEFLYYTFLEGKEALVKQAVGGAQPNISQIKIKNSSIPLPPLSEQKRIVSKLDALFAEIETLETKTKQNLENAKELFQSYLQGVFEDKGDDWEEKKLGEVCEKITDGTHQTPKYFDEGVVFLSSKNVTSGVIDWDNVKYIDNKQHIEMHKRVAPRVGDILLAKNGTTGVAALVDRDIVFDIYVSLAHIRSLGDIIPNFMLYFVNSPIAKKQFNKRLKGVGVPNLHLKEIREVVISYPKSKENQQEIIQQLDSLSAETKKLESLYQEKLLSLSELKKSILNKAFKGEL